MMVFGELYLAQRSGRRKTGHSGVLGRGSRFGRASGLNETTDRQYGLGWWMRDMAGLPTAYAWGFGGQFILLVPDLDMVVVTTSSSIPVRYPAAAYACALPNCWSSVLCSQR